MDPVVSAPVLTPAERHYQAVKKANRDYYRRKNPEVKSRGRPKKVSPTPPPSKEEVVA